MYDTVIIGAGPAGMSASIYARRAMLNTLLLEKGPFGGGQIIYAGEVDNYLGISELSGSELAMKFDEHVNKIGVQKKEGEVLTIEVKDSVKEITLKNGEKIESKTIVIATGAKHRKLGIEGEETFLGAGISYCATCDGAFYKDKITAVIGGGDSAISEALYLSHICKKVYLIHRRAELRAVKRLQDKLWKTPNIEFLGEYVCESIHGNHKAEQIRLKHKKDQQIKQIEVDGVFVAVGMEPETGFLKNSIALDEQGYIKAAEDCSTNIPGVFAAGDVRTKSVRQIITAVADGAVCISSIEEYL